MLLFSLQGEDMREKLKKTKVLVGRVRHGSMGSMRDGEGNHGNSCGQQH